MDPAFSEFSYGFALSYEVMNAFRPTMVGSPLFPSLLEEANLGYDVAFAPTGWPLFLQFKLARYMKQRNAKYWGDYNAPYFRIDMHKRDKSNQHNLLRDLSKVEPEVYYAAPCFYQKSDFDNFFVTDRILMKSQFFPVSVLPKITDNDQHHIIFRSTSSNYFWHSNHGESLNRALSGRDLVGHLESLPLRRLGEQYFLQLRSTLVRIIDSQPEQQSIFQDNVLVNLQDLSPLAVIRDLRYLLASRFGVEMILFVPQS